MRPLTALVVALILTLAVAGAGAQPNRSPAAQTGAQPGPPVAALITVSPPDEDGIVTLSGEAGAVAPNAFLAIRNLYTEETVYLQAGITGSFSAELFGPGNTPFWISPVSGPIPAALQGQPGSLPGGPGTIVYGPFPEFDADGGADNEATPVTQIALDGDLSDWTAYTSAGAALIPGNLYALINRDSFYLGAAGLPDNYASIQLLLTIDSNTYTVTTDPRVLQGGVAQRVSPSGGTPQRIGVVTAAGQSGDQGTAEARFPLAALDDEPDEVRVVEFRVLDASGAALTTFRLGSLLTLVDEIDGVVRLNSPFADPAVGETAFRFSVAGPVAEGNGHWSAHGRANTLALGGDDAPLRLELDFSLQAPALAADLVDLRMSGELALLPVAAEIGAMMQPVGSVHTNNGWSTVRTASGLAIDNLTERIPLGEASVEAQRIIRHGDDLLFGLDFTLTAPAGLPDGMYVPTFRGYLELGGERMPWEVNSVLGSGPGISDVPQTRLPVVLTAGVVDPSPTRLVWTLFHETPSDGSRGLLAEEDRAFMALSNRVRFDSPTYILPPRDPATGDPIPYPLEPYLISEMPNLYRTATAPLIPFQLPGGELRVTVTRPNGTTADLGTTPIAQNRLSTAAVDERQRYGAWSPVDIYRLTTLNSLLTDYAFDTYGDYTIRLSGSVVDVWGNTYSGGGTYRVLVANLLDLTPGALPGTPFETGDVLSPVVHVAPAVAADITATLRVYPLDGSDARETVLRGQANRYGYAYLEAEGGAVRFDVPGEYTIDYEARYTDAQGRLWAASLRGAGVIANPVYSPDSRLIAHGRRGVAANPNPEDVRPAWFNLDQYASVIGARGPLYPNWPYHRGDVAWFEDGGGSGLMPALTVQDRESGYSNWIVVDDVTGSGSGSPGGMTARAAEDELPITMRTQSSSGSAYGPVLAPDTVANDAYAYFSAVRPGVTQRQFVLGSESLLLPRLLDPDDRHNSQLGAGVAGNLPGDYVFLFGGAVVRNPDAGIAETAIYGALGVVVSADDARGTRIYPPFRGEAGGPDGGPLLVVRGMPISLLFNPTGVGPGDTLAVGDTFSVAGHVGPTLPSIVTVTVISPSGQARTFEGAANAIGYFYDPAHDFPVDEVGVWTVDLDVRHEGLTSAGPIEAPIPTGGVVGSEPNGGRFSVYVLPPDAEPLPLDRSEGAVPATSTYNVIFPVPAGWNDVQASYTVTMPGFILDQGTLPVTQTVTYAYNATNLNRVFPNYELEGTATGAAVSDVVTLTVTLTGTDATGLPQARNRVITIFHDRLVSLGE